MAYVRGDWPDPDVRSVPATLLAFLLLLMLSVTTPTGTGDGVHSAVLLHPLFAHTHVVDGRIVVHQPFGEQAPASTPVDPQAGPAIGAEAGAAAAVGLAISPTLPLHDFTFEFGTAVRWPLPDTRAPIGLTVAPPDPPPTLGV